MRTRDGACEDRASDLVDLVRHAAMTDDRRQTTDDRRRGEPSVARHVQNSMLKTIDEIGHQLGVDGHFFSRKIGCVTRLCRMGCASPVIGRQETTGVWRIDRTRDGQGNPRVRSGRRLPLPRGSKPPPRRCTRMPQRTPENRGFREVSFPIPSCPLCVPSTSVADPHHGWGSFTGVPRGSPVGSTSTSTDAVAAPCSL